MLPIMIGSQSQHKAAVKMNFNLLNYIPRILLRAAFKNNMVEILIELKYRLVIVILFFNQFSTRTQHHGWIQVEWCDSNPRGIPPVSS
ncbi:hypothetical protein H1230_18065 [Paenibacillus sp. 19GGS1-52]|uniref:hypothetical protein n=1 Tax=Paenibacillus sp. 19GGS1-52 TaxID=2758563 RepID=UPI001EFA8010|nr:hypothetical protein [Paenibacillus sp. 19GGS1-52]ULO05031.1 hypothetical protein H1230_18065 [Paenibacillus sp. 19GGS1-52]